jgi:phosphatidate cytidylyltransferase
MLKARVATALALACGFVAALYLLPQSGWIAFIALAIAAAAWEWGALAGYSRGIRLVYPALTAVVLAWASLSLVESGGQGLAGGLPMLAASCAAAVLFWVIVVPVWLRRRWRIGSGVVAGLLGWLVLVPPGLALVGLRGWEPAAVLAAMAAVWIADIAAYFCGRSFGRRKLAPQISPGKTWEGALGAGLAVTAYALLLAWRQSEPAGLGPAAFAAVAVGSLAFTGVSILGDLFESMLKRQAGLKDSGYWLPGHGGVLDRIDSLTSTLPLVGLLFAIWRS